MINLHHKKFKAIQNSENGETSEETIFHYQQVKEIVTATYSGGKIVSGQLIGLISSDGNLDIRYQQINVKNEIQTGTCISKPEMLENGKIRLYETWQWTSGDLTKGTSIIEEI
jgi:hypothetical protein